jgi:DNA-binding transcriptional ArsR family regulator
MTLSFIQKTVAGAEKEGLLEAVERYGGNRMKPEPKPEAEPEVNIPKTFTAVDLMNREFPEPKWIVEGLLPEGLTLFAGPPKIGKSWLALSLCVATASAGHALGKIPVERGEALYVALEDTPRRLRSRLGMMLNGEAAPEGLHLATQWERLDQGGADQLENWLLGMPKCRLIIIDTLQRLRPPQQGNRGLYEQDYATLAYLKSLADTCGVAIVVVHHLRKGSSDDPLEEVSGTTGLTGAADTIWTLKRDRGRADAVLFSTGRDIDESETALQFDKGLGLWTLLGDAEEYRMTHERGKIIEILKQSGEPMTPKGIAEILGKTRESVQFLISKLVEEGSVEKVGYGQYTYVCTPYSTHSTYSTCSTYSAHSSQEPIRVSESKCPILTLVEPESQLEQGSSARVSRVSAVSKEAAAREVFEL